MKKILLFLSLSTLVLFTGCEFINTKILNKPSKAQLAKKEQMRLDSIKADSLLKIEMEQARLDSIANAEAEAAEAARLAELEAAKSKNKFHVISGSFKDASLADKYKEKMVSEMSYANAIIVAASNGFNLVSVGQHETYRKAFQEAQSIMDKGTMEAWVYEAR